MYKKHKRKVKVLTPGQLKTKEYFQDMATLMNKHAKEALSRGFPQSEEWFQNKATYFWNNARRVY